MIRERIAEMYDDALLFLDPPHFDAAIVGVVQQFDHATVCYSVDKVLEILMEHDGMSDEEAIEYFEFNIIGAWMGENTPSFLEKTG